MGDDGRDGGGGNLPYKIDPRRVATEKLIGIVVVMYPRGVARGSWGARGVTQCDPPL